MADRDQTAAEIENPSVRKLRTIPVTDPRPGYVKAITALSDRAGKFAAEIVPGVTPQWHAVITAPGAERQLAAHLVGRGFGVFLPERDVECMVRGRKVTMRGLFLPGYVFVFVWDLVLHLRRIAACPGALDFLCEVGGGVAVIPDAMIDCLRALENAERPMELPLDRVAKRKRQRRCRRRDVASSAAEIVGVHAYSPFIEALRSSDDDDQARRVFRQALGLPIDEDLPAKAESV